MMRATRLFMTIGLICLAAATFAADWPQFNGPNANGIAPDTGINKNWNAKPPKVLWKVSMGDKGYAGPSVADGKVFIIDHDGNQDVVTAISLKTGKSVWEFAYADQGVGQYGAARSTPVYSDGKLYTISRFGAMYCINASTGKQVWARNIQSDFGGEKPQWDYSMSPLVDGNKVIVCPGGETGCAALDKNTGKTLWTGGLKGAPGYATPVAATLRGQKQYVIFAGSFLYGVDADKGGSALWKFSWEPQYKVNAATPIVAQNFIFITSGYGQGCTLLEITPTGAQVHWQNKNLVAHFNSPIFYNNCFFGIGDGKGLVCINPKDGSILWQERGLGQKGGIVAVDDVLIGLHSDKGDVVMFSNSWKGYEELGRTTPLGGQSWTAPIIADGKLIIRNKDTLACLDLM